MSDGEADFDEVKITEKVRKTPSGTPRTPFLPLWEYVLKESDLIIVGKHCFIP